MYGRDLSFIHDTGFGDFAHSAAPGLISLLRRVGVQRGRLVELGCGSGAATKRLLRAGYEVVGIDASPEMIRLARRNAPKAELSIGCLPRVSLPACDAVVAVGEVLNYMSRSDFAVLFRRVFAALRPGGVFLFDARQPGFIGGPVTRGRAGKDWAVLAASFEKKDGTLRREVISFRRAGGTYHRSDETHRLTLLTAAELSRRLRAAGFKVRASKAYGHFALPPGHVLMEARRP